MRPRAEKGELNMDERVYRRQVYAVQQACGWVGVELPEEQLYPHPKPTRRTVDRVVLALGIPIAIMLAVAGAMLLGLL
jgi:hypothetical protein